MRLKFLDCEIDLNRQSFARAGAPRHLEPQVFDLLAFLAQASGRLVSRDELVDAVWAGRIVSEATIHARIAAARRAVGDDGRRQAVIATVARRGIRFVPPVERIADTPAPPPVAVPAPAPAPPPAGSAAVRLCRSRDGTRLAFATTGDGPPVVRAGHWLTHLEHDLGSPLWRPVIDAFSEFSTFVRYDARGNGLSDRDTDDLSLATLADDLLAVADAAGLDRFVVYGTSQGVPIALTVAERHPERVRALVLHGGFSRGRTVRSVESKAAGEAYVTLMRQGWAAEGSQFLQAFASIFIPDGSPEQVRSLTELQRIATDVAMAVRLRQAFDAMDVTALLPSIRVPTLVLHARNDGVHPLSESIGLAAEIAEARLVVLDSRNHVLVPHEPAWPVFYAELRRFLGIIEAA